MIRYLLALLLCGCVTTATRQPPLPTALVGQWVTRDFEAPNPDAEPTGGFVIYILADGRGGWLAAPEIGSGSNFVYHSTTRVLTMTNLSGSAASGPETSYRFKHDPARKTLTLLDVSPPEDGVDPRDYRKMKLKWRSHEMPLFMRKAYRLP